MLAQGTEEVRQQAAAMLPLREQNQELASTNQLLKEQLEGYHSKFEEFQGTLTKSNQVGKGRRAVCVYGRRGGGGNGAKGRHLIEQPCPGGLLAGALHALLHNDSPEAAGA
jgi:hypothetical protein